MKTNAHSESVESSSDAALAETAEFLELRPKLRPGLRFAPRTAGGERFHMIEDEAAGAFHRVGPAEYAFLSRLDGRTTVGAALAATASLGADALTEREAAHVCRWLVESGLAGTPGTDRAARVIAEAQKKDRTAALRMLDPIAVTVPLFDPNRLLELCRPLLGWLFSPIGALLWCAALLAGGYELAAGWGRFTGFSPAAFGPHEWAWLAFSWAGLRVVHELGHGLACRRFGARTGKAGVLFLLFIPLPYTDVTAAWRFAGKWPRIAVSLAGVYVELLIAAVAALVWARVAPGIVADRCQDLILTAGVGTLLFNLNPLMRFDGYHVLADLLGVPNLADRGRRMTAAAWRRVFLGGTGLGDAVGPTEAGGWRRWVVGIYGPLAGIWRAFIGVSLIGGAAALLHGAGLIVAAPAGVLWFGRPVWRAGKAVANSGPRGWCRAVHVEPGEWVKADTVLFELENPDLARRAAALELDLEASRVRRRRHLHRGELAAAQVEARQATALASQQSELTALLAGLTVKAPVAGRVTGEDLAALEGVWVRPGRTLASLSVDGSIGVLTLADADERPRIVHGAAASVRLIGEERRPRSAVVATVEPTAGRFLPHPAFGANVGGPLPVVAVGDSKGAG
ncbi:efflux RND transporter periplasmic adaptor subunit, partial [Alienimonas chondri]|uniref:efflux RND transporter periplasmic adaptor subunit n=1 Tax=Alienimonas chondri TaxID=2681879 RepID=UPI001489B7E1